MFLKTFLPTYQNGHCHNLEDHNIENIFLHLPITLHVPWMSDKKFLEETEPFFLLNLKKLMWKPYSPSIGGILDGRQIIKLLHILLIMYLSCLKIFCWLVSIIHIFVIFPQNDICGMHFSVSCLLVKINIFPGLMLLLSVIQKEECLQITVTNRLL